MSEYLNLQVPKEEILNPQTILMLEDIESRLPEEDFSVITENGRINKKGREIADSVYQEFLSRTNNDFGNILELCKEAESVLNIDKTDSKENETVKIIQSIRGKVVYNSHRIWVEKQMKFETGIGDVSASNVMHYAKVLKKDHSIDIYQEATEINKQIQLENVRLEKENIAIINADLNDDLLGIPEKERISLSKKIKSKITTFVAEVLETPKRRKILATALSALVTTSLALGYVTNASSSNIIATNKAMSKEVNVPTVTSTEEIQNDIEDVFLNIDMETYLESENEIPDNPTEVGITVQATEEPDIYIETELEKTETISSSIYTVEDYWNRQDVKINMLYATKLINQYFEKQKIEQNQIFSFIQAVDFINLNDPGWVDVREGLKGAGACDVATLMYRAVNEFNRNTGGVINTGVSRGHKYEQGSILKVEFFPHTPYNNMPEDEIAVATSGNSEINDIYDISITDFRIELMSKLPNGGELPNDIQLWFEISEDENGNFHAQLRSNYSFADIEQFIILDQ